MDFLKNVVSVVKTNGYLDAASKMASLIGDIPDLKLSDGDRVLIKPNLCNWRHPSTGAITHPLALDALLGYLRTNFNDLDITVVESDATASRPDITVKWFGYDKVFDKWDAKWCNLSKIPYSKKRIDGLFFKEIETPEIFDECDFFITLPKLKTHSLTLMTGALKNQFGCLPQKVKSKYHKNIHEVVADCNLAMRPDLSIVDGVISMGGGVAVFGVPIKSNLLIAGSDPVSTDVVCARILGYSPRKIGPIKSSIKLGVGTDKYELKGDFTDLKEIRVNNELPSWKRYMLDFGRLIERNRTALKMRR